jgi:hypothetical protein
MEVPVRRVRARDGTEQVLINLADFIALLDAASAKPIDDPLLRAIVTRLRANLEADHEGIPLDEFLAAYDAEHEPD